MAAGVLLLVLLVWRGRGCLSDPWRKGREADKVQIVEEAIRRHEQLERERRIREQIAMLDAVEKMKRK